MHKSNKVNFISPARAFKYWKIKYNKQNIAVLVDASLYIAPLVLYKTPIKVHRKTPTLWHLANSNISKIAGFSGH